MEECRTRGIFKSNPNINLTLSSIKTLLKVFEGRTFNKIQSHKILNLPQIPVKILSKIKECRSELFIQSLCNFNLIPLLTKGVT